MVAKNPAENDDQIIDLTELIEKGEVPANDSSAQAQHVETEQETIQKHLSSLNDDSAPAEAAIDDLLAQMDKKEDAQQTEGVALDFSAPSTQTDHPIDPNEELHMPGMGDVDSLLNSLDIPPQPGERDAKAAPEDADQAVDNLLNDVAAPAPAAQPSAPQGGAAQTGAPDLDELLAAADPTQQQASPSAIDDLLREGLAETASAAQPATPPPAPQKSAPTFSSDELDSLLAAANVERAAPQAEAQTKPEPAAAQPVAQSTSQPEPASQPVAKAAPQAAVIPDGPDASMDLDIDSLLAAAANDLEANIAAPQDVAQNAPAPEVAPQPEPAAQPVAQAAAAPVAPDVQQADMPADTPVDIDSLLAAAAADAGTAPDVPQESPVAPELEAPTAAAPQADMPADMPADTPVDIDSLLAAAAADAEAAPDVPQEAPVAPEPEAPAAAVPGALDALDAPQADMPEISYPEAVQDLPPEAAPASEPDLASELAPAPEPAPAAEPAADDGMGPDFDALLAAAAEEVREETSAEKEARKTTAKAAGAPPLTPDEILPPNAATPEDILAEASMAAAAVEISLKDVMAQATEASSQAVDAFAQAFEASTSAADAADAVAAMSARVEQCEHALQEASERIIALETALEAQIAAVQELTAAALPRQELEALFTEDQPLHQKITALVADAVAQAMAAAPAPQVAPEAEQAAMDERLQPVVTATRSITARMDALEARLDELEPRFNDRVEKAAAGAAARILREEIGRLLDEQ